MSFVQRGSRGRCSVGSSPKVEEMGMRTSSLVAFFGMKKNIISPVGRGNRVYFCLCLKLAIEFFFVTGN